MSNTTITTTSNDTSQQTPLSKTYNGSCHCGSITYSLRLSPPLEEREVVTCNCTMCTDRGLLVVRGSDSDLDVNVSEEEGKGLTEYQFHKKIIKWNFCKTCGSTLFGRAEEIGMVGVNVRSIKDIDLKTLKLKELDGRKW